MTMKTMRLESPETYLKRRVHSKLTFIQESGPDPSFCNGGDYWVTWSVTLSNGAMGSVTEAITSNTTILSNEMPCPNGSIFYADGVSWSNNESVSTITFLVPYGSYSYKVVGPATFPAVFGQVDFSPSNTIPVEINLECC